MLSLGHERIMIHITGSRDNNPVHEYRSSMNLLIVARDIRSIWAVDPNIGLRWADLMRFPGTDQIRCHQACHWPGGFLDHDGPLTFQFLLVEG